MSKSLRISFFLFGMLFAFSCIAAGLTEKTVKGVISKVDNAIVNLDVNGVSRALSDNVTIIINIEVQGQTRTVRPSKQEYLSMLRQGWSSAQNYKYSKSKEKIKMVGNKALVTSEIDESMTIEGKTVTNKSKEEVTVEMVNGKPQVTKLVGYTSL